MEQIYIPKTFFFSRIHQYNYVERKQIMRLGSYTHKYTKLKENIFME